MVANAGTAPADSAILDDLAIRRRWVHCDAALSGLPLALMEPDDRPGIDFIDGVDSIIVSGHKFLGSPIPSGPACASTGLV